MWGVTMPTEMEKKNLEVHVELSTLREQLQDDTFKTLEKKIEELVTTYKELKTLVDEIKDERTNQLIKWGTAIIVALFSALGMLFLKILVPALLSKPSQ